MGFLTRTGEQLGQCIICVAACEDATPKTVYFCQMCGVFMCDEHFGRLDMRAIEAAKTVYRWMRGN